MVVSRDELLGMTVPERLALIELIWSTIEDRPDAYEISDELAKELDRRMAEYRRHPEATVSWEELRARLDASDE
ncbi:MAG TPA: addiction module protein [Chloroflexota bacterium]|jgi:putative addiction module component (TIGR02574 family)|nr:addiction module protein [Chloroflexota bacterium]